MGSGGVASSQRLTLSGIVPPPGAQLWLLASERPPDLPEVQGALPAARPREGPSQHSLRPGLCTSRRVCVMPAL